jgi:ribosome biogenesis protein ENP2
MHGYFLSLKLYDTARVIANPFAYAEHRERQIKEKIEKMAETRIRAPKGSEGVKVNRVLAEKLRREEERELAKLEKKKVKKAAVVAGPEEDDAMIIDTKDIASEKPSLLADPRFSKLFEDPEYTIDESTREFALLNPSSVAQRANNAKAKTAVEEEAEESDKQSSDDDGDSSGGSDASEDEPGSDDSSDAGGKRTLQGLLVTIL